MAIQNLPEFAKNGQKNTDGLVLLDGFPVNKKPARQWFNFLFNQLTMAINAINAEKLDATSNAVSASKLATPRSIGLSGGVTGTATNFDGTGNIIIPVTSVDATKLNGTASINTTGNAASATRLQNARRINNVLFDGLQDISIEAPVRFNGTISNLQQLDQALLDGKYTVTELNVAGLYGYGFLVVIRSGSVCHQIYYPHQAQGTNNGTMAMRQSWNANGNSATWSEWRVVGTRDDSKLPLAGGTVTGNLRVNGIIFSNKVYGDSDLWFTSENEEKARRVLTGGVLVSDSYSEASLVPNLGIYAKGAIHTKTGVYADKYYGYSGPATYTGYLDGKLTTPCLINGVAFDASTGINIPPVSFYIPAGADLNNYKKTGFYYQNADIDAAKITNVPQGNAFALRVEESAECSQWLTPYNGGGVVYYRHFYNGKWSTWIKMDPHNIDGNAATATKLQTARKINFAGAVTGSVSFDGSTDVTCNLSNPDLDILPYLPQPYPKTIPPSGYLSLAGQAITQAQYPKLYGLYGATLPDMRGEFIRGFDNGRGVDLGRSILSWQGDDLRSHTHSYFQVSGGGGGQTSGGGSSYNREVSTSNTGGTETRPRNISFNYIVKAG